MLGMEYSTGAAGSAGEKFDITQTQENTFKIDDCEIQVFVRDDGSNAENTATVARELIDVQKVNILVGTVSSAPPPPFRASPRKQHPLIVAPPPPMTSGVNFEYTIASACCYQDARNECCSYPTAKTFVQIAPDYATDGSAAAFRDAPRVQNSS
jgi:hypothetical protein